ncbi:periplasmic Cu(I)/Cu(II)-binding protein CopK [Cupriavidus basilensis]
MFKKFLIAASSSMLALSALAADPSKVEKTIELKDGTTLYIFKDGKMSMENKAGKTVGMKEGVVMETKDGQQLMMKGNEIWRLDSPPPQGHSRPLNPDPRGPRLSKSSSKR